MHLADTLHPTAAAVARRLPRIRGVGRIGAKISQHVLPNVESPVIQTRMRDGTSLLLDIRSRTEIGSFWSGDYEVPVLRFLKGLVPDDGLMLDVGANIGFVTVGVGHHLQEKASGGRVIAFEPVTSNFDRLTQNVELNSLQDTVQLVHAGLGAQRAKVAIAMDQINGAATGNAVLADALGSEDPQFQTTTIQIERLDDLVPSLGLKRLDLIKVDIEGAEIMFLQGAMETFTRFRPVIFGEFNSYFIKQFGHSVCEADVMLRPLGYRPFRLQDGKLIAMSEVRDGDVDLVFKPHSTSSTLPGETRGLPN